MSESTERRILAAIRPVDAILHLPLADRMRFAASGIRMVYNLHGEAVLMEAPGLRGYGAAFDPPVDAPAVESVRVDFELHDPSLKYLPRRLQLGLPRDPDPAHASQLNSVFRAVEVEMYPAPASPITLTWAVVHAVVRDRDSRRRLPWTLIQVRRNSQVVGQGLSDARGEAFIAVPGIAAFMASAGGGGGGGAVTREITVTFRAYFDSDHVLQLPSAGFPPGDPDPNQGYLPDPDDLLDLDPRNVRVQSLKPAADAPASNARLASGSQLFADLLVILP